MKFFISKGVTKEGRDLVFGNLPDSEFTIMGEFWTMNDVLKELGAEINPDEDMEIPRGFSQFKAEDGDFEKSIFILNV
jgi:hypothetical protein